MASGLNKNTIYCFFVYPNLREYKQTSILIKLKSSFCYFVLAFRSD